MKTAEEIENPAWALLERIPKGRWETRFDMYRDTTVRHFPHSDTVPDDFGDHPALAMETFRVPADLGAFNQGGSAATERMVFWRSWFTSVFAWAIPSPTALNRIAKILNGRPLVELGAGNGYWAWCLSQMGVDVVAYDRSPFGSPNSWYGGDWIIERQASWADQQRAYFDVQEGDVDVLTQHGDRVLFLCWPPYGEPTAARALETYPGDTVIFIGEGDGGCTADETFWRMVTERENWDDEVDDFVPEGNEPTWEKVAGHYLPKFDGLHDDLYVFERIHAET